MQLRQITTGVRRMLGAAGFYDWFQKVVGAEAVRARLAREYIRARPSDRVLDIGCGTGRMLAHLPPVEYYGFDLSGEYIAAARRHHGGRGSFWQEAVTSASLAKVPPCDLVLAIAILHHLDDGEARQLFELAWAALRPGGRLVTYDCCFSAKQSRWARWIVARDRGQCVRREAEYRVLAEQVFPQVRTGIWERPLRVPYTSITLECQKPS